MSPTYEFDLDGTLPPLTRMLIHSKQVLGNKNSNQKESPAAPALRRNASEPLSGFGRRQPGRFIVFLAEGWGRWGWQEQKRRSMCASEQRQLSSCKLTG